MTENPYQEVIDWLHTPDGIDWERRNYIPSMWAKGFFSLKEDELECSPCQYGGNHESMKFIQGANITADGPYLDYADRWIRGSIPDLDFNQHPWIEREALYAYVSLHVEGTMTGRLNGINTSI